MNDTFRDVYYNEGEQNNKNNVFFMTDDEIKKYIYMNTIIYIIHNMILKE